LAKETKMIDWDKDEAGDIMVLPLAGYAALPAMGTAIAVRMTFLAPADEPGKPSMAIQFVLGPVQANQLAEDLSKIAARLLEQKPTGLIS
jgi:hypothetical protein